MKFRSSRLIRLSALILSASLASIALSQSSGHVPGRVLVKFNEGTPRSSMANAMANIRSAQVGEVRGTGVKVVSVPSSVGESAALRSLLLRPDVEFAELDYLVAPEAVPNDPYYMYAWHLGKIGAPAAWGVTTGSSSIIVAIIDSGCDPTHPDLGTRYVAGWNSFSNNSNTSDMTGHGTMVAGCAAASSNNGQGVASVAWGVSIMPIKVVGADGVASYSSIASGLTWAADHGARVANISFGVTESATVTSAAKYMQSKKGVVTAAAGNYGEFHSAPDNPSMLTVSASYVDDTLTTWSDYGNNVDLCAPGSSIWSTKLGGTYVAGGGTSYSAPIVAGVAALVMSAFPAMSGLEVQQRILDSCDDLGAAGWDVTYGNGRVNAFKAVSEGYVGGGADSTSPSLTIISPTDGSAIIGTTTVSASADDNVGVSSVEVFVDGVSAGSLPSSPYSWNWNTASVPNGQHNLTLKATDGAGNSASQTISVTVLNPSDTDAPVVTITSPGSGSAMGSTLIVTAEASDNVGVTIVELYVDGRKKTSDSTGPYSFTIKTSSLKRGAHTVQCRGVDAAGNVAWSQTVTVYK